LQRAVNFDLLTTFNTCGVAAMFLAANLLATTLLCVALVVVEPVASILAAIVLSVVSAIYYWTVRRYLDRLARRRQVHMTGMLQWIGQALSGFKEVRIFGRDQLFYERFVGHVAQVASADRAMRVLSNIPTLVNESILVIGVVTVIVTAAALDRSLSSLLPTLAMFGVAGVRIMGMMNSMVGQVQNIRFSGRAVDAVRRMVDELETTDRLMDAKDEPAGPDLHQHRVITLDRVDFAYPDKDKIAVRDINLSIARGRRVAFVGPSGAGKSTLIGLILGLLTPTSGRVLVDGAAIVERPRAWYAQLGYVPQSIFLLDDTLRANVLFGDDAQANTDDAVWEALEAAQLADFARQLPEGLATRVGENGFALSGGERQRLGIARAIYRKPAVLVLDEATAALDNLTERRFSDTILRLSGDMTIIIVAHRLSTVRGCDDIHYMEDGRIRESGSYRDLVECSAGFRALVDADARVAV
jgi:ATP-binding cassette subfamily C protein